MRSSKSRSRNKNRNNSPPSGNIVNRVFDSSGPEGKVRGTPQQIIDKYNQLARDAQLSGDRVALENFQQHSEHYTRMLAEAQKEQDARRAEQDRQREQNQQNRSDGNQGAQGGQGGRNDQRDDRGPDQRNERRNGNADQNAPAALSADAPQPDVDMAAEPAVDSNLVETPESVAPKTRRPRTRKPAAPKPDAAPEAPEAAE
ncbi:MAG: DUF4167 domain-containing protein [Rhodobacteraceae bacterium]|nr:DUF4167 domain-containing protein [Paracoccaceae bacterium]